MEELIKKHYHEQQEYILIQQKLAEWDHGLVDCEQLEKFCKKHERKKEIKRGIKKMIASIRKNMSSIIVSLIIAIVLIFVFTHREQLSTQNTSSDWLAQKHPVSPWLNISNGNESLRVHQDSMIVYTPIWNESGVLECYYILFTYQGSRITLEITDNEAGSMEEWKESIEACFPVGSSNE